MTDLSLDLLHALQCRAARIALGPSSMRGAGHRGVVSAGREFLATIDLARFSRASKPEFERELDRVTKRLMNAFPSRARHWGLARKGLNIFLRECLYTVYLRQAFRLDKAERFFEIPLDSLTGRALHSLFPNTVPRWKTVRGLRKPVSDELQRHASMCAAEHRIARVHLDALWWGRRDQ